MPHGCTLSLVLPYNVSSKSSSSSWFLWAWKHSFHSGQVGMNYLHPPLSYSLWTISNPKVSLGFIQYVAGHYFSVSMVYSRLGLLESTRKSHIFLENHLFLGFQMCHYVLCFMFYSLSASLELKILPSFVHIPNFTVLLFFLNPTWEESIDSICLFQKPVFELCSMVFYFAHFSFNPPKV